MITVLIMGGGIVIVILVLLAAGSRSGRFEVKFANLGWGAGV